MNARGMVGEVLVRCGVHRLARRRVLGAILMLHRVRRPDDRRWVADPGLWVSDRQLAALIRALRREGWALATLDEALTRMAEPDGRPFACLTFDDGYGDFHDLALPVLTEERAPAALYATSGFIDRAAPLWEAGIETLVARGGEVVIDPGDGARRFALGTDDDKRAAYRTLCQALRRLTAERRTAVLDDIAHRYGIDFPAVTDAAVASWEMLESLAASPWVTIGGHTRSHPALARLPAAAVAEEMTAGRDRLERRLGITLRHFAYPYGDAEAVAPETVATAAGQHFASAVLAYGGPLRFGENPFALPRIGFGGGDREAALLARAAGLGRAAQPRHRTDLYQGRR